MSGNEQSDATTTIEAQADTLICASTMYASSPKAGRR